MRSSLLLLSLAAAVCAGAPSSEDPPIPRAVPSSFTPRDVHEILVPGNGVDRGDWGNVDLCPATTFVSSFELKYASLGNVDDTAGNGLKLFCKDGQGSLTYVASAEGLYGDWLGIRECSDPTSVLIGVSLEVLGAQGNLHDDLGVTNVQMVCNGTNVQMVCNGTNVQMVCNGTNVQMVCNGTLEQIDGRFGPVTEERSENHHVPRSLDTATREVVVLEDGRKVEKISAHLHQHRESPTFGRWVWCSAGYSICGLQTRVEKDHIIDDDAGLVDVQFYCC